MRPLGLLAILAWALYLYLGVSISGQLAGGCAAEHELQADHFLAIADLTCKDAESATLFAGLYLKHAVAAAADIAPSDVSVTPSIRITPGNGVFETSLKGRPEPIAHLDTNSVVDIVIDKTIAVKAARVVAITCPDRSRTACDAILEVPQDTRAQLAATDPSRITLAISAPDSRPHPRREVPTRAARPPDRDETPPPRTEQQ